MHSDFPQMTPTELARQTGVTAVAVRKTLVPRSAQNAHGGDRRSILSAEGKLFLHDLIMKYPKLRSPFYARYMSMVVGRRITTDVIDNVKAELKLTLKKALVVYSEACTEAVYASQEAFKAAIRHRIAHYPNHLDRCIWVDVTGFAAPELYEARGHAPIGQHFIDRQPSDRASKEFGDHHDVIVGINRLSGPMGLLAYEGHTNAAIFLNWLKYVLLQETCPGDHIYLDQASYFGGNSPAIRAMMRPILRTAGVNLHYIPARSPLYNPEEMFNGWLKNGVRKAVAEGRSHPDNVVQAVLDLVDEHEDRLPSICRGWIDYLYAHG